MSKKLRISTKLVNRTELAKFLGFDYTHICRLAKQGVLEFVDGKIDPEVAKAAIAANSDPKKEALREHHAKARASKKKRVKTGGRKVTAPPKASGLTYAEARVMRESAIAKIAELEYREKLGELVSAASVTQAVTDGAVQIRSSLELIPDKLAIVVAAETDAARCHALILAEVDATLSELSKLLQYVKSTGTRPVK